jgi:hypothetical protein
MGQGALGGRVIDRKLGDEGRKAGEHDRHHHIGAVLFVANIETNALRGGDVVEPES